MPEHITQIVLKALFAQNRKMKMETGTLIASLIQLTTVKEQKEHGEATRLNLTDTGSSIHMATPDLGLAMTVKYLVSGPMMMDPLRMEHGGSLVTALGSELLGQMILMRPSNTIAQITKSTSALISTTDMSTQMEMLAIGTGKHRENVTTLKNSMQENGAVPAMVESMKLLAMKETIALAGI